MLTGTSSRAHWSWSSGEPWWCCQSGRPRILAPRFRPIQRSQMCMVWSPLARVLSVHWGKHRQLVLSWYESPERRCLLQPSWGSSREERNSLESLQKFPSVWQRTPGGKSEASLTAAHKRMMWAATCNVETCLASLLVPHMCSVYTAQNVFRFSTLGGVSHNTQITQQAQCSSVSKKNAITSKPLWQTLWQKPEIW